ncbi:N-acetylmuramoyl-L-alanine amidase [Paenibacillus swuensis]|uniref:N-acetylmuramoyl-L-alanine amidase n=1 Tax=Paenibacillus swuensis TaxID=1178515 RepID=A0A172TIN1_9BACL|nr:N-acetylmuramoyl-L-alanine amidase CwlD [Paenibacillus swuensis]ANE46816.1 N-acetylmuramoyl-L-alanine amidase [Paenibacillus swuensis]
MSRQRRSIIILLNKKRLSKLALFMILAMAMVMVFTYKLPSTKTWTYWTLPLSGKTIAIDAGHGGPDGGASSKLGVIEKEINLAIALQLRDYLQQAGAIVIMTREEDKDLADEGTKGYSRRKSEDLLKRAQFIKSNQANLMVSIHMNAIPSDKWSGAQTFYYDKHQDNQLLAALIQDEIKNNLQNTTRQVKKVPHEVFLLKAMDIPAALVEVGFLSNLREAELLADASYQKKVAASIYTGILRYYSGEKLTL